MPDAETPAPTTDPPPRRLIPPTLVGLLVVGSMALVVAHYTVALIGAVARGNTGAAARSDALVRWGLSAWLPVALAVGVLLARRATRTREHLVLGSFLVLAFSLAFFGRSVFDDLETVRTRAAADGAAPAAADAAPPESTFESLSAGCHDGCPPDVAMTVCQRFCACLVDQVRRADLATQQRLLTQGDEPAVQQEMGALAQRCPGPDAAPEATR